MHDGDDVAALLPYLREGEAVAATGIVEMVGGTAMVLVDDGGTLVRVGALGQALPIGAFTVEPVASPNGAREASAIAADSGLLGPGLQTTSLLAMALVTVLSLLVTAVRRRVVRQRMRAVLVGRLAGLRQGSD